MRRALIAALLLGAPLVSYAALVGWLERSGAAGLVLGAVSGESSVALVATAAALALRLYTVIVLPGIATAWLVLAGVRRWARGPRRSR